MQILWIELKAHRPYSSNEINVNPITIVGKPENGIIVHIL